MQMQNKNILSQKLKHNIIKPFLVFSAVFFCCVLNSCVNPFAPTKIDGDFGLPQLGNQKTIDGFFQNFLYAYNFKDTVVYSRLLAENFVFAYRNYEKGLELTLSRTEDMMTTYRLFSAVQNLDFIWNEIVLQSGDDVSQTVMRSFNLTITFSPTDIVRIWGRVNFVLTRADADNDWKLEYWYDESNY